MEERCVALKLLLDELAVPSHIETVADRKRVQKAVYLVQQTGLDLGYQYSWYLMGPYSSALTRDYYDLAASFEEGEEDFPTVELRGAVLERLQRVKPLMTVPESCPLDQSSWLELIASVHYLQKARGLNPDAAEQELKKLKPDLAPWVVPARRELEASSLLP
jgi:uncharacterized protein YwgA